MKLRVFLSTIIAGTLSVLSANAASKLNVVTTTSMLTDLVRSIAAGTTIAAAEARHLVVADGSPARNLIESSVTSKTPFVFVVTLAPRLESGAALPAGMLAVEIRALLGLGLR